MKWWEVIKYNWSEVRKGEPPKSKDQFEQQLLNARDEIIKEKVEMSRAFQEKYSYKSIEAHKQNVLKM